MTARIIEATAGKTRDLPIKAKLREILLQAGIEAGVEIVRVTSGGQARKGSGGKRTGSTRHDDGNAGDLQLEKSGRVLSFETDRAIFVTFVTACFRLGATGIGAGIGYMGQHTIHVGFGTKLVWGAGGLSANAPAWLRAAMAAANGAAPSAPRTLRRGMSGDDVKELQRRVGVKDDGDFGERTEIAVKAAQSAHGLKPDGVIGKDTREELGL
jgi:hypothetical protein